MPKISVIIPVYNVEKTLSQTLESVIFQSFKDIQIICVNDCSTDSSALILDNYAKQDARITIVNNEKNLGLGLSRNVGLQYANGEYIHFLDADDWMEIKAYEILAANTVKNPDVVCFLWNNVNYRNGKIRSEKFLHNTDTSNFLETPQIIDDWGVSVWHRIYRKEFLDEHKILFNDFRCMEDVEFLYKVLIDAEQIKFVNECLLNYRTNNPNSLIGKAAKYYQCIMSTYKEIAVYSEKLPLDKRDLLLANLFNSTLYKLLGSYVSGELTLKELKCCIYEIDVVPFLQEDKSYKWYGMYHEIMNSNPFMLKFRYKLKSYLKNNFYPLYEFLKRKKA